jgi:hypothetical protein
MAGVPIRASVSRWATTVGSIWVQIAPGVKKYSSPFWQVIRKFEKALTGDTYNCAWLNLNRWDDNSHAPSLENQQILSELDFILLEELRLLDPDLVIFFTGPWNDYDQRIGSRLQHLQPATRVLFGLGTLFWWC